MIHTKPIESITYQDIMAFCADRNRESIHLDYKRDIDRSLAKTIAAMANTWGGVVIIGVDEEDSAPKLPIVGIPYRPHIREQINNLILGNIMPPVFPEVQVAKSEDGESALAVIRVPQSHLTPHAIKAATRVYIRTDTSNEPEELATVDRIQWLAERRKSSEELKSFLFKRAGIRFGELCEKEGVELSFGELELFISPRYPFETLRSPDDLKRQILGKIQVRGWNAAQFPRLVHRTEFQAAQHGIYGFFVSGATKFVCYEELSEYGSFYHREDITATFSGDDETTQTSYLHSLLVTLDLFFESMKILYAELGYWGVLELRIGLNRVRKVGFRDLPVPRGYSKFDNIVSYPLDDSLEFKKLFSYGELAEGRIQLLKDLIIEVGWALGFSRLDRGILHELLEEAGRA